MKVTESGIVPSEHEDSTAVLQELIDTAAEELYFPVGTYRIGTLRIPERRKLVFAATARIVPIPEKIQDKNLLVVTGDNVRIEGLHYDFAWNGAGVDETPLHNLIYAEGVSQLSVSGIYAENSDVRGIVPLKDRARRGRLLNFDGTDPAKNYSHQGYFNMQCIVYAKNCRHVVLENSSGKRLHAMLESESCTDVTSRGNRMTTGNAMTEFREGGECLRHHDNWSRDVKYQVVWFGGSPDPGRKIGEVPLGTSTTVDRETKIGDEGYNKHTSGAFDVFIQNNYAEYGNTLAWGNKGRQVVINGNIARFISDYAYGTEGGENIVFSNNISINCTAGGICSMYWGEKLLISGNLVLVRHEPWSEEWSWWDNPAKYLGPFIRLHHGPPNPEDRYGAGTVQITGNQLVNELGGRSTAISIQSGRDVNVSGNKLVNGRVDKFDEGKLTVMNNEFIFRLPWDDIAVSAIGKVSMAMIKGNIIRKEPSHVEIDEENRESEKTSIPYMLFTEEDAPIKEGAEEEIGAARKKNIQLPAISLKPDGPFFGLVQDNVVMGWQQAILTERKDQSASFVMSGNTSDGRIGGKSSIDTPGVTVQNNIRIPRDNMPSMAQGFGVSTLDAFGMEMATDLSLAL